MKDANKHRQKPMASSHALMLIIGGKKFNDFAHGQLVMADWLWVSDDEWQRKIYLQSLMHLNLSYSLITLFNYYFRKNKMEIQLAESKFELSSLNDQLMEAIQQKMALSQELEQWQVC